MKLNKSKKLFEVICTVVVILHFSCKHHTMQLRLLKRTEASNAYVSEAIHYPNHLGHTNLFAEHSIKII